MVQEDLGQQVTIMCNGHELLGKFIVVEGIDGTGKSTVIRDIRGYLENKGIKCIQTREPGGTELGEQIRRILLHDDVPITVHTEMLLHYASRCEHVQEVIIPTLRSNTWVICDRFEDSTFAYQDPQKLEKDFLEALSDVVMGDFQPDLVIYLDAPPEVTLKRLTTTPDNYESANIEYFREVRKVYKSRALQANHRTVDASQELIAVKSDVLTHVKQFYDKVIKK